LNLEINEVKTQLAKSEIKNQDKIKEIENINGKMAVMESEYK